MHSSRNVTHALTYSFHKKFAKILCARTSNMIYFRNSLAFQLCRSHFFSIQGPDPKPVKISGNLSTFQWALDQSLSVLTRRIVPTSHWKSKTIHLSLCYINRYMYLPHRHELENGDLKSFAGLFCKVFHFAHSIITLITISFYNLKGHFSQLVLFTNQQFFSCVQKCKHSMKIAFS